ncbi:MAG TPA: PAS domain-containing protein [Alphaproteobacteria bacterium]|nr:PAS domain-containing protein [Alphaproteobacteria bacterium]
MIAMHRAALLTEVRRQVAPYPTLSVLLDYWERLCGPRAMPRPRDFDILEIPSIAGSLHMVEARREDRRTRFFFRVYGSTIASVRGVDYQNRYVDDCPMAGWVRSVNDAFQQVVDRRMPEYSETGRIFDEQLYLGFRRLTCPLSTDGDTVDRLLCAAVPLRRGEVA